MERALFKKERETQELLRQADKENARLEVLLEQAREQLKKKTLIKTNNSLHFARTYVTIYNIIRAYYRPNLSVIQLLVPSGGRSTYILPESLYIRY